MGGKAGEEFSRAPRIVCGVSERGQRKTMFVVIVAWPDSSGALAARPFFRRGEATTHRIF